MDLCRDYLQNTFLFSEVVENNKGNINKLVDVASAPKDNYLIVPYPGVSGPLSDIPTLPIIAQAAAAKLSADRMANVEMLDILVQNGARGDVLDYFSVQCFALLLVLIQPGVKVPYNNEVRSVFQELMKHIDINVDVPANLPPYHLLYKYREYTWLHIAADLKLDGIIEDLIRVGCNPNFIVKRTTPLHIAAENRDLKSVTNLLKGGGVCYSIDGKSPLYNLAKVLNGLYGIDIKNTDVELVLILNNVSVMNYNRGIKLGIETPVEPYLKLFLKHRNKWWNELVTSITESNIFTAIDGEGKNILHLLLSQKTEPPTVKEVQALLEHPHGNMNLWTTDVHGNNPLHCAIISGNLQVINYVVDWYFRTCMNTPLSAFGVSVLTEYAEHKIAVSNDDNDSKYYHYKISEYIPILFPDIPVKLKNKLLSVLELTADYNSPDFTVILGEINAYYACKNLTRVNNDGKHLMHLLCEHATDTTLSVMRYLNENWGIPILIDGEYQTCLHTLALSSIGSDIFAYYFSNSDIRKNVLQNNIKGIKYKGYNIFHCVCQGANISFLETFRKEIDTDKELIVKYGAEKDINGNTPFHIAARSDNIDIVHILLGIERNNPLFDPSRSYVKQSLQEAPKKDLGVQNKPPQPNDNQPNIKPPNPANSTTVVGPKTTSDRYIENQFENLDQFLMQSNYDDKNDDIFSADDLAQNNLEDLEQYLQSEEAFDIPQQTQTVAGKNKNKNKGNQPEPANSGQAVPLKKIEPKKAQPQPQQPAKQLKIENVEIKTPLVIINAVNNLGRTPLHESVFSKNILVFHAIYKGYEKLYPALINNPDTEGMTLLHLGAEVGNIHVVKAVYNDNLLNLQNKNGQTPLMLALQKQDEGVINQILTLRKSVAIENKLVDKNGYDTVAYSYRYMEGDIVPRLNAVISNWGKYLIPVIQGAKGDNLQKFIADKKPIVDANLALQGAKMCVKNSDRVSLQICLQEFNFDVEELLQYCIELRDENMVTFILNNNPFNIFNEKTALLAVQYITLISILRNILLFTIFTPKIVSTAIKNQNHEAVRLLLTPYFPTPEFPTVTVPSHIIDEFFSEAIKSKNIQVFSLVCYLLSPDTTLQSKSQIISEIISSGVPNMIDILTDQINNYKYYLIPDIVGLSIEEQELIRNNYATNLPPYQNKNVIGDENLEKQFREKFSNLDTANYSPEKKALIQSLLSELSAGFRNPASDTIQPGVQNTIPKVGNTFGRNILEKINMLEKIVKTPLKDRLYEVLSSGSTLLHLAVERDLVKTVLLLLDDNYQYNFSPEDYMRLFMLNKNNDKKDYVNMPNKDGRSALHLASRNNNILIMKILLIAGADPNQQDRDGNSAANYVCENPAALELLKTYKGINNRNKRGDTCVL